MSLANHVDLPSSMACLKNMDTLLRCPICFDFLSITMMSQCSHNFCSLCIRKFLSYKLQCPVCNLPMTEQDLRNNRILDDLVKSFQDARKQLSQVQFDSPPISPKTPSSAVKRKAQAPPQQPRGPKKDGSVLSHFFHKQPCAVSGSASEPRGEPEAPAPRGKRPRTSCLRTAMRTVKQEPLEEEEEEVPRANLRNQAAQHPSTSTSIQVKEEKTDCELSSPSTSMDLTPVAKVECPVCEVPVAQQHINKHLDTCLRSGEKKDALRSSGRRKPMAKVVYTLLTQAELKRRLRECHLSTQGTKDHMIKRHQEFLHIYNAECDSQNPRPAEVIAKEVETNEKMRMQLDKATKSTMVFRKDQTEEEIEAVHSSYRKQHSSEFSRLVAQVRGRMETSKRARQIKQEKEAASEESSHEANLTEAVEESPSHQEMEAACAKPDTQAYTSLTEIRSRSPSPSPSEVSISSSISDVFS